MPRLLREQAVDGRDEPGHDELSLSSPDGAQSAAGCGGVAAPDCAPLHPGAIAEIKALVSAGK